MLHASYLQHQQWQTEKLVVSMVMVVVVICSRSGMSAQFTTLFSAFSLNRPAHTYTFKHIETEAQATAKRARV